MHHLLLSMPVWLSFLILVLIPTVACAIVPIMIRRKYSHDKLKQNNEVAGFKYAVLGVIYAVLLAFITLVVYEEFEKGRAALQGEASALTALARNTEGYRDPHRSALRKELVTYAKTVVTSEWPLMAYAKEGQETKDAVNRLWKLVMSYQPATSKESLVYSQTLTMLDNFYQARRARVLAAEATLSGLMWFNLWIGAILTIGFSFFFGAPNLRAQVLMTAMLTVMIMLCLFLILQLDNPFYGAFSLSPEPLQHSINTITGT